MYAACHQGEIQAVGAAWQGYPTSLVRCSCSPRSHDWHALNLGNKTRLGTSLHAASIAGRRLLHGHGLPCHRSRASDHHRQHWRCGCEVQPGRGVRQGRLQQAGHLPRQVRAATLSNAAAGKVQTAHASSLPAICQAHAARPNVVMPVWCQAATCLTTCHRARHCQLLSCV